MKSLITVLTFLLVGGIYSPILAQPEPQQPAEQQPETPSTNPQPETPPAKPESPPEPPQLPGTPSETPPTQPAPEPQSPQEPPTVPPLLPGKTEEPAESPVDPANPLAVAAQGVPHSVTLVAEVHEPARLLNDLQKYFALFTAADPQLKARYEEGYNALKALLGGDPYQSVDLKSLGLEPARPWRISLLELNGKMEPAGIVLSAAVSDPKELDDTLEKIFLKQDLNTKVITQEDQRIIQVLGANDSTPILLLVQEADYLHLFLTGPSADKLQAFKDYAQEAARRPLSRDRRFHPVTFGLTPQADVSGYLNLKSIADKLPLRDTPALLNDFSSAAFQLTSREWNTQVLLSRYSGVAAFLRPGSRCQELISQADPPLVSLTYSLEQPVPLLHYLMSNIDPTGVGAKFTPENVLGTGLTLEQLAELVRDGSGGLLFYEGENYQSNSFVVLACFQVTDRDAGYNWMARMAEENQKAFYPNLKEAHLLPETQVEQPTGIQVKKYGPNTVWTVKTTSSGIAYAQVGDFVIMGDAVKQIHNLARGEGDGWKPHCGTEELFSAEIRVGEYLKSLVRHQDNKENIAPALEAIDQYFGKSYHLVGSVQYEEGLLKTSVKPALGTFGETGTSLALLPYWAELAAGWTRKVYSEENAYPLPETNPTPVEPAEPMPQPEPKPEEPQPTQPPKKLTPGGEDIEPAPQEPKTPSQPKKKPAPSGGDEGPAPTPKTPEGENSPSPKQPKPAQPKGTDEPEPEEKSPDTEPMAPGNAEPKTPPAEQTPPEEMEPGKNDGPGRPAPQENQEPEQQQPAPGENREPKPKKPAPGGDQEPEDSQPSPGENKEPEPKQPVPGENKESELKKPAPGGDQEPEEKQSPAPSEKLEPQSEKQPPEAEPSNPGEQEAPEAKEPAPNKEEPQPEAKQEPRPKKPSTKPRKKTEPGENQEPQPKKDTKPESQPEPEKKNSSRGDKAPSHPGQKASQGGGEGPNVPFKEETKRHMAPLFHGIRIISGRSLGEFPGQMPFKKTEPPASPDETSLDAGRSRQPSGPDLLTPDQRHAA